MGPICCLISTVVAALALVFVILVGPRFLLWFFEGLMDFCKIVVSWLLSLLALFGYSRGGGSATPTLTKRQAAPTCCRLCRACCACLPPVCPACQLAHFALRVCLQTDRRETDGHPLARLLARRPSPRVDVRRTDVNTRRRPSASAERGCAPCRCAGCWRRMCCGHGRRWPPLVFADAHGCNECSTVAPVAFSTRPPRFAAVC